MKRRHTEAGQTALVETGGNDEKDTRARMRAPIIAVLLTPVLSLAAAAQTPELLGSHRDWNVYAFTENSQTVCYMASEPKKQEGDYTRRGNPVVLVTRRPGSPAVDEVSVQPGYSYPDGSEAQVDVGGREFMLFTRGEHAWTKSEEADQALINEMKHGPDMTVRGTSVEGAYSLDMYSLLGFTAAYEAMVDACNQGNDVPRSQSQLASDGPSERETIEYIERIASSPGITMGDVINAMSTTIEGHEELLILIESFHFFYTEDNVYEFSHEIAMPLISDIVFEGNDITFRCAIACIQYRSVSNYGGEISEKSKVEDKITFHHLNREQTEKLKNALVHLLILRGIAVEDRGEFNEDLF